MPLCRDKCRDPLEQRYIHPELRHGVVIDVVMDAVVMVVLVVIVVIFVMIVVIATIIEVILVTSVQMSG